MPQRHRLERPIVQAHQLHGPQRRCAGGFILQGIHREIQRIDQTRALIGQPVVGIPQHHKPGPGHRQQTDQCQGQRMFAR